MKPQRHSIDGFIPRRAGSQLGDSHPGQQRYVRHAGGGLQPNRLQQSVDKARTAPPVGQLTPSTSGLSRSAIDESLNAIPPTPVATKKRRFSFRKRKPTIAHSKRRRTIKIIIITIVIIAVAVGGWLGYKALQASSNIFQGNIFGLAQTQPLKQDANGRSNILVLGTSEDDPGHGGAYLTDSMMVISIDQNDKSASMFSIPRDLYVKYGMACNSGYEGKINEYFNCVNDDYESKEAEVQRLTETRAFIGNIFGMDIQYATHINNTVIKDAVNAVGGIDVDIQGSNAAPGILDRNFDWRCNYDCFLVKYDNGVHRLDGERALFLAMARGDIAPTYGLGNSNFDREKNQQKIIIALKDKALSTGTFSDISKVTGLLDSLGDNLRTNFETSEIRTLMQLGIDIPADSITRLSLVDDDEGVVRSGSYNGASVVIPSSGIFDYADIRMYLKQKLSSDPMTREGANVVVLNGSGVTGVAQTEADKLADAGFIISDIANAPGGTYADVEIYQIGTGKTATKAKLASAFGVTVKTTVPPVATAEGTNFVVIIGKDRSAN